MSVEAPCYLIINDDKVVSETKVDDLRKALERGDTPKKIAAMKTIITCMLQGEKLSQLLMPVLRCAVPVQDHTMKKLLLVYWEVFEKNDPTTGKLKPEMILACNSLLGDLNHASEYVRGSTFRLLSKLKEPELLEALIPSLLKNLDNRHAYVRRNAVQALHSVFKNTPHLIPNAPELMLNFLATEGDASCRRNALLMLYHCSAETAFSYLGTIIDQVPSFGEVLQTVVVEIIRKASGRNPADKPKYVKCIYTLLSSTSAAVRFDAASTLILLTSVPTSIKAATSTYIDLLCTESDNNVKLVILDRLNDVKRKHGSVMQEQVMDLLRVLSSPTMDIRRKTLDIVLDLVSPKNIDEIILVLKKELNKTQDLSFDKGSEYRQMVVQTIHQCAVKFPDVACTVVHLLMDFLGESASSSTSAVDVVAFVKEVIETYPNLRKSILVKLLESLPQVRASKVYRSSLWIIGEYSEDQEDITLAFATIKDALHDILNLETPSEAAQQTSAAAAPLPPAKPVGTGVRVLADGTYATQAALPDTTTTAAAPVAEPQSTLKTLLHEGDHFLATIVASTLTKLVIKANGQPIEPITKNKFSAEVMLFLVQLLQLGTSSLVPRQIDNDSAERITLCLRILAERNEAAQTALLQEGRKAFSAALLDKRSSKLEAQKAKQVEVNIQADDQIKFGLLTSKTPSAPTDTETEDLEKITGLQQIDESTKLSRIVPLTGYSDPLYAEATVIVHQYDIVLDVLIINQTSNTVQNVTLELSTVGDLKLCDHPQLLTIPPGAASRMKSNIKVSSTETGIIFGNLTYEVAGQSVTANAPDRNCVVLNEIRIDVLDYISPATCTDIKFRQMWAEFEWENKIVVNTNITDIYEFLQFIVQSTNMNCITPKSALAGDCGFLSANLYAKSVFGEDALCNVSIENENGKIGGFIRIRSKTQGIALSLGEKVTLKQKANRAL